MATKKLGNLQVGLGLDSAEYTSGLDKARRNLASSSRTMNTAINKLERNWDKFSASVNRSAKNFLSFKAVIGAAAGTAGLGLLIKRSLDTADAIAKAADSADFGIERFQSLTFAAEQSGVAASQFEDGVRRLNRRLGLFIKDGGGPAAAAFEQLGLSADIASGKLQGSEAVFDAAIGQLARYESFAEKAALASQLFGEDSGPKLALLVNKGREEIARLERSARDLGIVIDADLIRKSEAAGDKLDTLSRVLKAKLTVAVVQNADKISNLLSGALDKLPRAMDTASRAAESLAKNFGKIAVAGGILIGAGKGAAIGGAIGGPVGAGIGAGVGAVGGAGLMAGLVGWFDALADSADRAAGGMGRAGSALGRMNISADGRSAMGVLPQIGGVQPPGETQRRTSFSQTLADLEEELRARQDLFELGERGVRQKKLEAARLKEVAKTQTSLTAAQKTNIRIRLDGLEKLDAAFRARDEQIAAAADRMRELDAAAEESARFIPDAFGQAFDRVGNSITDAIARGEDAMLSLRNVGKAVAADLIGSFVKLAAVNPLKNFVFGGTSPTLGSVSAAGGGGGLFGGIGTSIAQSALGQAISKSAIGKSVGGLFGGGLGGGLALGAAGLGLSLVASKLFGGKSSVGPNAGGQLRFQNGAFARGPVGADNGGDVTGVSQSLDAAAELLNLLTTAKDISATLPKTGPLVSYIDTFGAGGIRGADDLVKDVIAKGVVQGLTQAEKSSVASSSNAATAIQNILAGRESKTQALFDFGPGLQRDILRFTDPRAAALADLSDAQSQRREAASGFGISAPLLAQLERLEREDVLSRFVDAANDNISGLSLAAQNIERLQSAVQRAEANVASRESSFSRFFSGVLNPLTSFRDGLNFGSASPLSAQERFAAAQAQFDTVAAGARNLDSASVAALPGIARTLIDEAGAYGASGTQAGVSRNVLGVFNNVISQIQGLQSSTSTDLGVTMRTSISEQTVVLAQELRAVKDELVSVRQELARAQEAA